MLFIFYASFNLMVNILPTIIGALVYKVYAVSRFRVYRNLMILELVGLNRSTCKSNIIMTNVTKTDKCVNQTD